MTNVIACIDGSASAPAVCDYAAWASRSLQAPLTFLHVLDQQQYPVAANLSGNIGLGSREHLLDELASLDEQRSKLALEQGRIMLANAKERAIGNGVTSPESSSATAVVGKPPGIGRRDTVAGHRPSGRIQR